MSRTKCRIYVGNLPPDIRTKDIEDLFYKFGKIAFVDLKTRRGPPFAFVEFVDPRDAKDAVYSRDGYDYDGYKLRVEFPRGRERGPGGVFKSNSSSSSRPSGSSGPPSRRSNYRIKVTGLPPTGSWQDLKDHMREAGDVCYADVYKDGTGVVEFLRYDDMKYAIKKLDDSRFRSHEGEVAYVRITEDTGPRSSRAYSRSRSRSPISTSPPKRSRGSPTYSPARSRGDRGSRSPRSRSRSPSQSPMHTRSKSRTPPPSSANKTSNNVRNGRSHGGARDSRSYSRSRSASYSSSASSRSRSPSPEDSSRHSGGRDSSSRSRSPSPRSRRDDSGDESPFRSRSRSESRD